MSLVKTKKLRKCKKCNSDIWMNDFYYPQRKNKALCFNCGGKRKRKSFIGWLLNKLK